VPRTVRGTVPGTVRGTGYHRGDIRVQTND
jgi:hypothetical protein